MRADLHIHTTASDGRLSPPEVYRQAAAAGLACIAITDHDTLAGVRALRPVAADGSGGPAVIAGIELSADVPGKEVHILGFCLDPDSDELNCKLARLMGDRLGRAEKMVSRLNKLGYSLEYDRVLEIAGKNATLGRPHVAAALVEKGYFPDAAAVFAAVLGKDKPGYVPHYKFSPSEAVRLIKSAGGIPVLAHPGLVGDDRLADDIIGTGVMGLEVYHPAHDWPQTEKYLALAARRGLLVTGGSDFHGIRGRYPEKLGDFSVPAALARRLLAAAGHESPVF